MYVIRFRWTHTGSKRPTNESVS